MKQSINKDHPRIKNRLLEEQESRDEHALDKYEERKDYEQKIAAEILEINEMSPEEQEQLCREEMEDVLTSEYWEIDDAKNAVQNVFRKHGDMVSKVALDKEL